MPIEPRPIEERFWPKVLITPACWIWQASLTGGGYGHIGKGGKCGGMVGAHRASYEIHYGPIPDGMVVRHKCDNPPCVNPDHLELGTHADNVHDRIARGRTRLAPCRGEKNGRARLTREQVEEIRSAPWGRGASKRLAAQYGVHWGYINLLRQGKGWESP